MRRILVLGLLLAFGLTLAAGCGHKDADPAAPTEKPVQRLKRPGDRPGAAKMP